MNVTLASWNATWRELGAASPDTALFNRTIAAYSERHRHYHTLQHLRECFELFTGERANAAHPAEIEVALWLHDVVYDVHRNDNEERSAGIAHAAVLAAGLPEALAQRIHMLIMATVHDAPPGDDDARLLVDVDLSILGSTPARFDESDGQIRMEFAHVPDAEFRVGRQRVLHGFLARDRLYCTDRFHLRFEQLARENILRSLARLQARD